MHTNCSTNIKGLLILQGLLASQTHVDLLIAGDHSFIQEECKACAISLFQADTLLEGLHWWQLPDFAGGMHLVRGTACIPSCAVVLMHQHACAKLWRKRYPCTCLQCSGFLLNFGVCGVYLTGQECSWQWLISHFSLHSSLLNRDLM